MAHRGHAGSLSVAIVVASVSLPLAAVSANSFFGIGSALVVPTIAVGLWGTLSSRHRDTRAWWFGFTVAAGLCLPLCPGNARIFSDFAAYVQQQTQRGKSSLSVNIIELGCLLATVFVPALCASLAGIVAGKLARGVARRDARGQAADVTDNIHWQFSLRELLLSLAALGLLLAFNGHYISDRAAWERQNQRAFLARFQESFRSGEVELLAEPAIAERQGATITALSFKPPGMNEYRIVAPIERDGLRRWAVWAYATNEEDQELIYQYAYAEAEDEELLPKVPAPLKRYIDATWDMVDGVPSTAGASATVIAVAPPKSTGEPLAITARAPAGTVCELMVFPRTNATARLAPQAPNNNGLVSWSWMPEWAGPFQYELKCIENRASGRMVNVCRGTIPQFIVGAETAP